MSETIKEIPLEELHPFPDHPFGVRDDEAMAQTVADGMVADKEAALKKLEKAKAKGGATIAEKIAAEKERKAAIEAAKAELAKWKEIAGVAASRKAGNYDS